MNSKKGAKISIYDKDGVPIKHFNRHILEWLKGDIQIDEHDPPAAFEGVRQAYDDLLKTVLIEIEKKGLQRWDGHKYILSHLTDLMFGVDILTPLSSRLSGVSINSGGFRSPLAQGSAKNMGENFVNAIVYTLADALIGQDEILVDKNLPPILKPLLRLEKIFIDSSGKSEILRLPVEGDMCIFSRRDPTKAIIISAKTRLKEVFHVGTMWALFFEMLKDPYCQQKWNLKSSLTEADMHYVFATSDSIKANTENSQGPDLKPTGVRNLIKADASFFNYVFVSKNDLPYVSTTLNMKNGREALFHELGCLLDLIEQKYAYVELGLSKEAPLEVVGLQLRDDEAQSMTQLGLNF